MSRIVSRCERSTHTSRDQHVLPLEHVADLLNVHMHRCFLHISDMYASCIIIQVSLSLLGTTPNNYHTTDSVPTCGCSFISQRIWITMCIMPSGSGVGCLHQVGGGPPVPSGLQCVCRFVVVPCWHGRHLDVWL